MQVYTLVVKPTKLVKHMNYQNWDTTGEQFNKVCSNWISASLPDALVLMSLYTLTLLRVPLRREY